MDSAYELYDLENDPEELNDLVDVETSLFSEMKEIFLDHLADANRPFSKNNLNGN
jgi:hypothetical protein